MTSPTRTTPWEACSRRAAPTCARPPPRPPRATCEVLSAWTRDVLVSDVGMPGEDGYAFIAALRADATDVAQIPAVALTAYASREDKVRLLSAGFQAHVPKPLDAAELVAVIASLGRPIGKTEWS